MTGEKLRSLRRDHKPSKEDGDLLAPGEEEAAAAPGGIFTGGRGSSGKGGRAGGHRIFSNHHHRLPLKGGPAAGGTGPPAEPDKCPAHFPVHECVFKGDVRRLSALIRTQGIGQKDSHGERTGNGAGGSGAGRAWREGSAAWPAALRGAAAGSAGAVAPAPAPAPAPPETSSPLSPRPRTWKIRGGFRNAGEHRTGFCNGVMPGELPLTGCCFASQTAYI